MTDYQRFQNRLIDWFGNGWYSMLRDILTNPKFANIALALKEERKNHDVIPFFENRGVMFRAFKELQPKQLQVVYLGLDPYSDICWKQSPPIPRYDGLAFSNGNNKEERTSATLANMLMKIHFNCKSEWTSDEHARPTDLIRWVKQGVLLANTALSVRVNQPGSHLNLWLWFTTAWIRRVNSADKPICWVLLGNDAQYFSRYITNKKHLVVKDSHPSPSNISKPFKGTCFNECNEFLVANGIDPICW